MPFPGDRKSEERERQRLTAKQLIFTHIYRFLFYVGNILISRLSGKREVCVCVCVCVFNIWKLYPSVDRICMLAIHLTKPFWFESSWKCSIKTIKIKLDRNQVNKSVILNANQFLHNFSLKLFQWNATETSKNCKKKKLKMKKRKTNKSALL